MWVATTGDCVILWPTGDHTLCTVTLVCQDNLDKSYIYDNTRGQLLLLILRNMLKMCWMELHFDLNLVSSSYISSTDFPLVLLSMTVGILSIHRESLWKILKLFGVPYEFINMININYIQDTLTSYQLMYEDKRW